MIPLPPGITSVKPSSVHTRNDATQQPYSQLREETKEQRERGESAERLRLKSVGWKRKKLMR